MTTLTKKIIVKDIELLSSLISLTVSLKKVTDEYKEIHLKFASRIYESNNSDVFSMDGYMPGYEAEVKEIINSLERQMVNLKSVRKRLERSN